MEKQKKKKKRTPSPRQVKAAKAVVKNLVSSKPKPNGEVLEDVGYSKAVAETPSSVINSEGFQMALAQTGLRTALVKAGINSDKIAEKIGILLEGKNGEHDDYNAIDKGLKHATAIYGITEDKEDKPKGNIYNFFMNEAAQQKVRDVEVDIKKILTTKRNVQQD